MGRTHTPLFAAAYRAFAVSPSMRMGRVTRRPPARSVKRLKTDSGRILAMIRAV